MNHPTTHAHADQLRNHWWWRPGWQLGTRFYTWHLTFTHQPKLHALVQEYQRRLADVSILNPIPSRWLHLTMQGVGFVDDVDPSQLDALVVAAQVRLAAIPPARLTFESPLVRPEAIVLPASPADSVIEIRDAIRDAFNDTDLGDAPEPRDGFLPHVSLAYVNQDGPADAVTAALRTPPAPPAVVTIDRASLIVLDRDNLMYQWREYAIARLGAAL